MLLLVTAALPTIRRVGHPRLGRLLTPRHSNAAAATGSEGIPWACDNDAFSGFDPVPYRVMLRRIAGARGCLFVTAPDVVGDAQRTLELLEEWGEEVRATGHPLGLVLQDGQEDLEVPWAEIGAVFLGGTTEWKLSRSAGDLCAEAKARDLWLHFGRANYRQRIEYAGSVGADSFDGSAFARWFDTYVPRGLAWSEPRQLALGGPS